MVITVCYATYWKKKFFLETSDFQKSLIQSKNKKYNTIKLKLKTKQKKQY